jgi:hypothetical protein
MKLCHRRRPAKEGGAEIILLMLKENIFRIGYLSFEKVLFESGVVYSFTVDIKIT